MEQALCNADTIESIHNLLTLYNSSASNLLNTHAPLKTKKLRITHNQPWFSDKIRQEIIVCRHKEKTWREDLTEYSLNAFYNQWCFVSNIIKIAKRDYYIRIIQDNRSDYKKIFSTANKLLYRNEPLLLPLTDNEKQLTDNFNNFFVTKIDKIMSELVPLETHPMDLKYIESSYETSVRLDNFIEIDSEYTRTLITSAPVKSFELDPIPTTYYGPWIQQYLSFPKL